QDRPAGRHLADARLAADPPLARQDSRGDRRGRGGGSAPAVGRPAIGRLRQLQLGAVRSERRGSEGPWPWLHSISKVAGTASPVAATSRTRTLFIRFLLGAGPGAQAPAVAG